MRVTQISDPDDPRIADYFAVRERDLVGRAGKFIIEGRVTLAVAVHRGRYPLESVFLAEDRQSVLSDVLKAVAPTVPIYVASQDIMDRIVGFPIHRGVLACARKPELGGVASLADSAKAPRVRLGLIGLSNHDNMGACFRNAAALGAEAVVIEPGCADPFYRKAIRVSAGTVLWMPTAQEPDPVAMCNALEASGDTLWALTPDPGAEAITMFEPPHRLALLLGAEGPGLPQSVLSRARRVRIPQRSDVDSLNVATAGAIALSHVLARA